MKSNFRFFKCNVLGGFRLSDLSKNIKQGEYFYVESHIADTSRAVIAALKQRWMIEVSEKEASKHVQIPKENNRKTAISGVRENNIGIKGAVNRSENLALPNVKEVNRNLESRQAENNKLNGSKPSIPNFKEAEVEIKKRQDDSMNKQGTSTDAELAKSLKDVEKAVGPDFSKVGKSKDKDEPKKEDDEVKIISEDDDEVGEVKISALSDDSVFDNSEVAVPELSKEEEVKQVKEKKIRRKRSKKVLQETE